MKGGLGAIVLAGVMSYSSLVSANNGADEAINFTREGVDSVLLVGPGPLDNFYKDCNNKLSDAIELGEKITSLERYLERCVTESINKQEDDVKANKSCEVINNNDDFITKQVICGGMSKKSVVFQKILSGIKEFFNRQNKTTPKEYKRFPIKKDDIQSLANK